MDRDLLFLGSVEGGTRCPVPANKEKVPVKRAPSLLSAKLPGISSM